MTPYEQGYSDTMTKLSVSPELAKTVLTAKGIGLVLDDLLAAQRSGKPIQKLLEPLKKYRRTIRRAGPEARREIYGPPQIESPPRWANMAWGVDPATKGRIETLHRLGVVQ